MPPYKSGYNPPDDFANALNALRPAAKPTLGTKQYGPPVPSPHRKLQDILTRSMQQGQPIPTRQQSSPQSGYYGYGQPQAMPRPDLSTGGYGLPPGADGGGRMARVHWNDPAPYMPDPSARSGNMGRNGARGSVMDSYVPVQQEEDTSFQFPTMADYLAKYGSSYQDGGGIDNRLAALQANRSSTLGAMDSATKALVAQLQASRGEVDARYTQGIQEGAQATQAAQQAIQGSYDKDRATNAEMFRNLGIEVDQTPVAAEKAFGVGTVGELGQASDIQQRALQLAQFGLNTNSMDTARMSGVENQAGFQKNYQSMLAKLLDEQDQRKQSIAAEGRSQYNNDRNFAYDQWMQQQQWGRQDAKDELDYEAQMAQSQAEAQAAADKSMPAEQKLLQQLMDYGVSPGKARQWLGRATNGIETLKNPGTRTDVFSSMFAHANNPAATAAIYNYLLKTGALKG